MLPLRVILHDALLGPIETVPDLDADRVVRIPADLDRQQLASHLADLESDAGAWRTLTFCSLDAARIIRRSCPGLAHHLLLDPETLLWHRYAGHVPAGILLNRGAILLPFGQLAARGSQLRALYGDEIFLRPDDPMKTFPGLVVDLDDLSLQVSGLRQVHHVADDTLVVVDRARELPDFEYRFWCLEGRAYGGAGYSLTRDHADAPPCPDMVVEAAGHLARDLEGYANALVADFVQMDDGPRLVELNGIATSGFYPAANIAEITSAAADLLV